MQPMIGAALVLAFVGWTSTGLAWWDKGHMQIAALAYAQLEPSVRSTADRLIALNPKYAEWTAGLPESEKAEAAFVNAATWADDIKHDPTYSRDLVTSPMAGQNIGYTDRLVHDYWHYVDIPFSRDGTLVRGPDTPNALTQVRLLTATLASDAGDDLKSYDLVWLLHLVGDLHQPCHATARFSRQLDDDRGGNDETIQPLSGPPMRLHLYWDALLGETATPAEAIAASGSLPSPDPAKADVADPALWIIESFTMAQNAVYTDIIGDGSGPFLLTPDYEANALEVAKQQAALAAARLANLLNLALK